MSKVSALMKFLAANKMPIGIAAGIGGAGVAGAAAAPAIDDFVTDQALKSVGRSAKRAISDTADFAAEHPYMAAGLVGASGLAGAKLGDEGFAGLFDTISPVKVGSLLHGGGAEPQYPQRGRGGFRRSM